MLSHKHVVAPPAPPIVPVYDPVSGLAFNTLTAVGGIRCREVDEAIAKITAANATLGAHLCPYLVGRLWSGADQATSILVADPGRFIEPTPAQQAALQMSDEQVAQGLGNLHLQDYFAAENEMQDSDRTPQMTYRGEPGSAIAFPPFKPITIDVLAPNGQMQKATLSPVDQALKVQFACASLLDQTPPDQFNRTFYIRVKFLADHIILDPWWNCQAVDNDGTLIPGAGVNLANLYLALARAAGLNV